MISHMASHDVMWPFHCISPDKSQNISLRRQRTPSHWNTETDDYVSWSQHSEKNKHKNKREQVSTAGCSLVFRLPSSFCNKEPGYEAESHERIASMCTTYSVILSLPPQGHPEEVLRLRTFLDHNIGICGLWRNKSHILTDSIDHYPLGGKSKH